MGETLEGDGIERRVPMAERERTLTRRILRHQNQEDVEDATMLTIDLLDAGRLSDARLVFQSACADDMDDADLLYVGARVARADHDPMTARALLVMAAKRAPLWVAPLIALADLLAQSTDWPRAWAMLERCRAIDPSDQDAEELRRRIGATCRLDARRRLFLADPDRDDGAMLANALVAAGLVEQALEVLEAALLHDPEDTDALFVQGNLLGARGETARARQTLRRVTQMDAGWAEAWEAIADVIDLEGDVDGAERLRAHAATIEVDPLMLVDLAIVAAGDSAIDADLSLALDLDRAVAEGVLAARDEEETLDATVDAELDVLLDAVTAPDPLAIPLVSTKGLRTSARGRPYVPPSPRDVFPRVVLDEEPLLETHA